MPKSIEIAYWRGRAAAKARRPAGDNPYDDFDLGVAWTTGYFKQRGRFIPALRLQARLARLPR